MIALPTSAQKVEKNRYGNAECPFAYCYKDMHLSSQKHIHPWAPKDLVETGTKYECYRDKRYSLATQKLTCIIYWSQSEGRHYRIGWYIHIYNRVGEEWIAVSIEKESGPNTGLYQRVGKIYDINRSSRTMFVEVNHDAHWADGGVPSQQPDTPPVAASPTAPVTRDCSRERGLAALKCAAENAAAIGGAVGR